jgi:hypothetical protein
MNAGGFRHHRRLDRGVRGQVLDDAAIEDDTGFEAADRRMCDTLGGFAYASLHGRAGDTREGRNSRKPGHVWTPPSVQEESFGLLGA